MLFSCMLGCGNAGCACESFLLSCKCGAAAILQLHCSCIGAMPSCCRNINCTKCRLDVLICSLRLFVCNVKWHVMCCTIQAVASGTPNTPVYNISNINRVGNITISIVLIARVCGGLRCLWCSYFLCSGMWLLMLCVRASCHCEPYTTSSHHSGPYTTI